MRKLSLFLNLDNVFDENYETFGLFGEADDVARWTNSTTDVFMSPAAPRAAWAGLRLEFLVSSAAPCNVVSAVLPRRLLEF